MDIIALLHQKIINHENIRDIVMKIKDALRLAFDKNAMQVKLLRKDLNGQLIKHTAVFDWPDDIITITYKVLHKMHQLSTGLRVWVPQV